MRDFTLRVHFVRHLRDVSYCVFQKSKIRDDLHNYEADMNNCYKLAGQIYEAAKASCLAKGCTVDLYKKFLSVTAKYPLSQSVEEQLLRCVPSFAWEYFIFSKPYLYRLH
jgi:hypothetical protein